MLGCIKYGPAMMSLILALKILVVSYDEVERSLIDKILGSLNCLLNLGYVGIFWVEGKTLGYCWKHQSLCKLSLWGLLFYFLILINDVSRDLLNSLAIIYFIAVLCILILYRVLDF